MTEAPRPLDAEIDAAVAAALAGHASLETLITRLLLGRDPDPEDPAWTDPEHRRIWSIAVTRWTVARRKQLGEHEPRQAGFLKRRLPPQPTLADVWSEIERVTNANRQWDVGPHLEWKELAARLQMRVRAAIHLIRDTQQWMFVGRGETRRCVRAPCVACGKPIDAVLLKARRCPPCRGRY